MVVPGLKARYVDVYLPSENAKLDWEKRQRRQGFLCPSSSSRQWKLFGQRRIRLRSDMVRELAETKEEFRTFAAI